MSGHNSHEEEHEHEEGIDEEELVEEEMPDIVVEIGDTPTPAIVMYLLIALLLAPVIFGVAAYLTKGFPWILSVGLEVLIIFGILLFMYSKDPVGRAMIIGLGALLLLGILLGFVGLFFDGLSHVFESIAMIFYSVQSLFKPTEIITSPDQLDLIGQKYAPTSEGMMRILILQGIQGLVLVFAAIVAFTNGKRLKHWLFLFLGLCIVILLLPLRTASDPISAAASDRIFYGGAVITVFWAVAWFVIWRVIGHTRTMTINLFMMMTVMALAGIFMTVGFRFEGLTNIVIGQYVHFTSLIVDYALMSLQLGMAFGNATGIFVVLGVMKILSSLKAARQPLPAEG